MRLFRPEQVEKIKEADREVHEAFTSPYWDDFPDACKKLERLLMHSTAEERKAARGRGSRE